MLKLLIKVLLSPFLLATIIVVKIMDFFNNHEKFYVKALFYFIIALCIVLDNSDTEMVNRVNTEIANIRFCGSKNCNYFHMKK